MMSGFVRLAKVALSIYLAQVDASTYSYGFSQEKPCLLREVQEGASRSGHAWKRKHSGAAGCLTGKGTERA